MAAKRWAYSWSGVTGSVDALSAARARKLIREKHQLKWVPNGAKVVRMDGTAYTPSVTEPAQPTAAVSQPDLSQQIATAVSTAQVGRCCPSCHRAYPKPKAVKVVAAVDLATLSQKELFAYYKRTAPVEDVRFMLRVTLSDGLRERVQALADAAPTMTRTNVYKALVLLQAAWRGERNAADRAAGVPAIGAVVVLPPSLPARKKAKPTTGKVLINQTQEERCHTI